MSHLGFSDIKATGIAAPPKLCEEDRNRFDAESPFAVCTKTWPLEMRGLLLWEHSPAPVAEELLSAIGHFGEGPIVPRGRRERPCFLHPATLSPSLSHEAGSSVTSVVPRSRAGGRTKAGLGRGPAEVNVERRAML